MTRDTTPAVGQHPSLGSGTAQSNCRPKNEMDSIQIESEIVFTDPPCLFPTEAWVENLLPTAPGSQSGYISLLLNTSDKNNCTVR